MKVTALIPDKLIRQVKKYSKGKNITESITIALTEWLKIRKLQALNESIESDPLAFRPNTSAAKIRNTNRRK